MQVIISPRLLPGVRVGDAFLSVEPTSEVERGGKPVWRWFVDLADGQSFEGADLAGWGDASEMLGALVSFLSACGESLGYRERTGREGENEDLFPAPVARWANENSDELALASLDEGDA